MNAMLSAAHPLPRCLYQGADSRRHRRRHVGAFRIEPSAVDRFNRVLRQFQASAPELDPDRLATAARELSASIGPTPPACIRERLFQVKAARAMAGDAAWNAPPRVVRLVHALVAQIHSDDRLIPLEVPGAGHLDDALLVDAAWAELGPELRAYADFHRLRRLACEPAGRAAFGRDAWMRAREEEERLQGHLAACRNGSYLQAAPARFVVH